MRRADTAEWSITLDDDQQKLQRRLLGRVVRHLDALRAISGRRSDRTAESERQAYDQLKMPRRSNAVGVFGPRGSGKTTILVSLLRELEGDPGSSAPRGGTDDATRPGWLVVPNPLDLSYAPSEFPFGMTCLHWLCDAIQAGGQSSAGGRAAFECASKSYFRGAEGFTRLVRDLAVTPAHYARSASEEIVLRRRLWADVRAWLDVEARERKVDGFVVAIDDLDLAPANRHHSLVWSLLDELHQDRVFFLVAADLRRLEKRLAEEDAHNRRSGGEVDLRTAADLVYKVLPQVDRGELQPWPTKRRMAYPPGKGKGRHTIQTLGEALDLRPVLRIHLPVLLPGWPRGLENVWRELADREEGFARVAGPARDDELDLIGFLAESTFNFDLARRLRERPLSSWAERLRWVDREAVAGEAWKAVRSELLDDEELTALVSELEPAGLPLSNDQARWVEVLLDVALAEERLAPVSLLTRVPLLKARLASCEVQIARTWEILGQVVDDRPACVGPALLWTRWDSNEPDAERARFTLGAGPLLDLALGARRPWPELFGEQLNVSRGDILSELPAELAEPLAGSARDVALDFLPRRTRSLMRVLDELGAQPWRQLDRVSSQTGPVTLARAAASLTYASLRSVAAKESSGFTEPEPLVVIERALRGSSEQELQRITPDWMRASFELVVRLAKEDEEALAQALTGTDGRESAEIALPAHAALHRLLGSIAFRGLDPELEG